MLFCLFSLTHRTSGHRNRNHGPSGQPSGRASHSATEIRGDLSHWLAFSSLKYYIAHEKSFGSSVATTPDLQYLKSHGTFLLHRGSRCDCTSRRSPCAFFFPLPTPPVTQRGLYGGKSLGVKSLLWLICLWLVVACTKMQAPVYLFTFFILETKQQPYLRTSGAIF